VLAPPRTATLTPRSFQLHWKFSRSGRRVLQ